MPEAMKLKLQIKHAEVAVLKMSLWMPHSSVYAVFTMHTTPYISIIL